MTNCSKILKSKLKLILSTLVTCTWLSNITFHMQPIWLHTFGGNWFRIMSDIISKLLRAAMWSSCADLFKSEQIPFPGAGSISFATNWAANFGCNWFRIIPDLIWLISKLLCAGCAAQPCEVSVLFYSNLSKWPFLGQIICCFQCFAQESIRNMWFCSYVIFLLRDQWQWMIKRLSQAMGAVLVCNKFLPIPSKISFHMKQKVTRRCPISPKH